jgi:hypothetical protein
MIDKTDGSYWYAHGGSKAIKLTSFQKMGVGEKFPAVSDELLKYQFIVDFSDDKFAWSSLTFKLTATVIEKEKDYAPELQREGKLISFENVTHELGSPTVIGESAVLTVEYAKGTANASKWNDREAVLVLMPSELTKTALPIDASFMVIATVGSQEQTMIVERNGNGNFIVAIDRNTTQVKFVLQSAMFTTVTDDFDFTVQLRAAYHENAPMNSEPLSIQAITLHTPPKAQNAAKITVVNHPSRIYNIKEDKIEANIDVQVSEGYTATVTLLYKNGQEYTSTGWSQSLTNGSNTIKIENLESTFSRFLSSSSEGLFCLSVVIRENVSNTAVLTVPYYLIMHK